MTSTPVHAKVWRATIAWLGAAGLALTDAAAKSAPDGYTLLLMSNAHHFEERSSPWTDVRF